MGWKGLRGGHLVVVGKAVLTAIGTSGWAVESDRHFKREPKEASWFGPVMLGPLLGSRW